MKQYTKPKSHKRSSPGLCGPGLGFFRGVVLANHLATKKQNTYITQKVAQQKTFKNLCQDRGQTEPGLVAFYNPPGNGAGLFFQPQSLHGAGKYMKLKKTYSGVGITPVIIISR